VSPVRDAAGRVVGASKIARDITSRRQAQEQQDLLIGEMKHRTRNFVAVIDAIARQSRPNDAPEAAAHLDVFVARLRALLCTGEIVVDSRARRASLRQLFELTLQPFVDPNRASAVSIEGPFVEVSEETAGGLALAVHELATNALKYGALKSPEGTVSLTWSVDAAGRTIIDWKERGTLGVAAEPTRRGFGSRVIRSAVAREPKGTTTVTYEPDGLRCRFAFDAASGA
jgi:two-component sensor histidine kinase